MTIFGVDIASGSPNSRQMPSYSLIILNNGSTSSHHMISRQKLIRLIREMQPEIVAMDNVYELANDRKDLINLLRRLPSSTRLVQVTGGDRPEALVRIARWHGITFDRTNPLQEAEACARLAAKGVGAVLCAFEDKTWIKVSRRRSPGRGGWSQNRYSRKIHGAVKGLAREVERQLREANIDFTVRTVEGLGGYSKAEFVVNAPRDRIHINAGYFCDAQLKIQSIERPQLQFKHLSQRRGYIIAGLDPGTTTGIAALNLNGSLIDLVSTRVMSSSDVIEWIAARGKPLIIATDVFPTPGAVEKVKRAFNAVLYSPGSDVPAEEKIALGKEFGYKNDHERDALAAALSAYRKYKNKFLQVEKKVPEDIDPDEVKALVVKGYSIENAIAEYVEPFTPEANQVAGQVPLDISPDIQALRSQIAQQAEQIRTLRTYLDEIHLETAGKDASIREANEKLDRLRDKTAREIKRDREIRIRDKEIERLRGILRSERKFIKRLKRQLSRKKRTERIEVEKGLRKVAVIDAFTRETIELASEQGLLDQGELILLRDASGGGKNTADLLITKGIEAVILDGDMALSLHDYFLENNIPVLSIMEVPILLIEGLPFIKPDDFEIAKTNFYEKRKAKLAQQKAERLESIIKEYQIERRKEEKKRMQKS